MITTGNIHCGKDVYKHATLGMNVNRLRIMEFTANYEIVSPGSNAMIRVQLEQGESLKAESGAMVAKSPNLSIGDWRKGLSL